MKIELVIGGNTLSANLEDCAAARDFYAMLPLKLTLEDYARTEKIADLSSRLSTDDAPDGVKPQVGDITFYVPWGNLAIFYRPFGYAKGLVRLGSIEGDVSPLNGNSAVETVIRRSASVAE